MVWSLQAQTRPNLVLILADDMGWNNLNCYGSDLHESPHLDRLAREGVRFTNAYAASPVCSPTRASIMTGKSPARLHMTLWREGAASGQPNRPMIGGKAIDSLPTANETLAEVLREAGYYTAHIGKWHLGRPKGYPQAHGFRVNIGGTLWGAPETFFYPYSEERADYFEDWRYVPDLEPGNPGDYLTDRLTDKALEVIENHRNRPFFINLWFYSVHTPVEGKPKLVEKYRDKIRTQSPTIHTNPHLAAMVESVDQNVGRILSRLKALQLEDNTIVLFASDNGGYIGRCKRHPDFPVTDNTPLRSGKGSCYEGGLRIPMIVKGPGLRRGGDCAIPVVTTDLYSTLLGFAGLTKAVQPGPDGVNLLPVLRDPEVDLDRTELFFHYPHYYATTTPVSAIRSGDWKLLYYYQENRPELYHLGRDPAERRDMAEAEPARVSQLLSRMRQWLVESGAQLPTWPDESVSSR